MERSGQEDGVHHERSIATCNNERKVRSVLLLGGSDQLRRSDMVIATTSKQIHLQNPTGVQVNSPASEERAPPWVHDQKASLALKGQLTTN